MYALLCRLPALELRSMAFASLVKFRCGSVIFYKQRVQTFSGQRAFYLWLAPKKGLSLSNCQPFKSERFCFLLDLLLNFFLKTTRPCSGGPDYDVYCMTGIYSNKSYFEHCFKDEWGLPSCADTMPPCVNEPGASNATFSWRIGHHMVNLHVRGKGAKCLNVARSYSTGLAPV